MTTVQEAFDRFKPTVSQITEDKLLSPTMDTQTIIGEAEELNTICSGDSKELLKVKLAHEVLESYSDRIDAFIVAEAEYNAVAFAKSEALTQWRAIEEEVSHRKFDLITILRFCFEEKNMQSEIKELKRISQGRGRRDMTVDYMELNKMAEKYIDLFDVVGEDGAAHVAYTAQTFEKLRALLGDINIAPAEVREKELLAKQVFTYLQQATNEIRRRGQFAFRNNEMKLNEYKSDFHQYLGNQAEKAAAAKTNVAQ